VAADEKMVKVPGESWVKFGVDGLIESLVQIYGHRRTQTRKKEDKRAEEATRTAIPTFLDEYPR
jgi:hypothetical protein